jgi:hypothetical protein
VTCARARRRLSALRDRTLQRRREASVLAHLEGCPACARRWRSYSDALDRLAQAPRIEPSESLAAQVLGRLELERRGPGLALLFRSVWAARPLIVPCLLPAALVVLAVIGAAVLLDRGGEPLPEVYVRPGTQAWNAMPAPGTEENPLYLVAGVDAPLHRGLSLPPEVLAELTDGTFFLETVVARDGSVADVTLLAGDATSAVRLMAAMRQQRFEPARYQGRPVAVSLYRLISRMGLRVGLS